MNRRLVWTCLSLTFLIACSEPSSSAPTDGSTPTPDASTTAPDASTSDAGIDAADASTPDASLESPDASTPPPDCLADVDCDDGLFCNGVEVCSAGSCQAGSPIACDDGTLCTNDSCDESKKDCVHEPDNGACDDHLFCTGQEACDPQTGAEGTGCLAGTPIACDDGVACTSDTCNEVTRQCDSTPSNVACDDGLFCNGQEVCDPSNGCIAGTPPDCSDVISCTVDSCNETAKKCDNTPNDADCQDGQLCNGEEICHPTLGCLSAGQPYVCPSTGVDCVESICDPNLNACREVARDDLCPCGQTCDATRGCGTSCTVKSCGGKVYACGDCIDNDGDCVVDSADPECLGPCDNSENSLHPSIPGGNAPACAVDCFFDGDTGSANDDCYWSQKCDPLSAAPNYNPSGSIQCAYDQNASIPGSSLTCSQAYTAQSTTCDTVCGPLVPNGCDCFGCCDIPTSTGSVTVWLGSQTGGTATCTLEALEDPTKCRPCTKTAACDNPCEECELCVGKSTLPTGCGVQACPSGAAACGLAGQAACPAGESCITGCCRANP